MNFKKKKIEDLPVPVPPPSMSNGNPGGVVSHGSHITTPMVDNDNAGVPEGGSNQVSEESIMGYGLMRLLVEIQGLREEQLKVLEVLEDIKSQ